MFSAPGAPSGLVAARVSGTAVTLRWSDNATDETGFVVERKTGSGGTFSTIATPGSNVTTLGDTGLSPGTTYYYRVRAAKTGDSDSANSNQAGATTDALPTTASWATSDVGGLPSGGSPGTGVETGGVFTVTSQAGDIGGTGEQFRYVYKQLSGDFTFVARVASEVSASNQVWAKSGIMIRESLNGTARNAAIMTAPYASGNQNVLFQIRDSFTSFTTPSYTNTAGAFEPLLLKLQRTGNVIAASYSKNDGVTWSGTVGGSISSLACNLYVGMFTSSHQPYSNNLNTATFDRVSDVVPEQLSAAAASGTAVNLAWTDHAANETGYLIQRSADGGTTWATVTTTAANVLTYADTGLTGGTTYTYRVKAVGPEAYSANVNVTTPVTTPAAPTSLTASGSVAAHVHLSWTDNSSNEDGFRVLRKLHDGAGNYVTVGTTATGVHVYDDYTVSAHASYDYRVVAYNASGDSAYASAADVESTPEFKAYWQAGTGVASVLVGKVSEMWWGEPGNAHPGHTLLSDGHYDTGLLQTLADQAAAHDQDVDIDLEGEEWNLSPASPNWATALANLNAIVTTIKNRWAAIGGSALDRKVGLYGGPYMGVFDSYSILDPDTPGFISLGQSNIASLVMNVDYIAPSAYIDVDMSPAEWLATTTFNLRAAKRLGAQYGKPVYPFTSSVYASTALTQVDDATWRMMLDTIRREADGVILWAGTEGAFQEENVGGTGTANRVAQMLDADPVDPPGTPTSLSVNPVGLHLSWGDVSGESGYLVERSTDGQTWLPVGGTLANQTTWTDEHLRSPGADTFYYRVSAVNATGSAASAVAQVDVDEVTRDPRNLVPAVRLDGEDGNYVQGWFLGSMVAGSWAEYDDVDFGAVNVNRFIATTIGGDGLLTSPIEVWIDGPGAGAGGTPIATLYPNPAGANTSTPYVLGTNSTELTELVTDGPHNVFLRLPASRDGSGVGIVSFQFAHDGAPATPTRLQVRVNGDGHPQLFWQDNSGDETSFRVQRSSDGTTWSDLATPGEHDPAWGIDGDLIATYVDTSTTSTSYYYRVRARRLNGSSVNEESDWTAGVQTNASLAAPVEVSHVATDDTTSGHWGGTYGTDGYWIPTVTPVNPSYLAGYGVTYYGSTVGLTEIAHAGYYNASGALDVPGSTTTPKATFAPFFHRSGAPYEITINFNDSNVHQVSLYTWDIAFQGGTIEAIDPGTGYVFDRQNYDNGETAASGRYETYAVKGSVKFRFTSNIFLLSGIFFD